MRQETEMKVHMHTKFCIICLLTFIFHQCNHCHEDGHDHGPKEEGVHYHNDYQISTISYLQNGGTESMPSKFSTLEAENEQKYYIEKIFDRYGENGRLSFFGLEKLLISLGLGEVKVVTINHNDIGHDHVSHLYALEVQEGKHSHSRNHPHSHSDSENQTMIGMAAKRNHKCDHERDTVVPSVKDDGKHIHDQSRHHRHHHPRLHRHHHNGTHHSRNDSVSHSEHGEQNHEPSTETNTTQDQPERKQWKQKKKQKKISDTSGNATRDYAPDCVHSRVHKCDHVHDTSHLHVHHREHSSDRSTSHGHQDSNLGNEDGHHHTSKRDAHHSVRKHPIFSTHSHKGHNEDERDREECLNVTQLLRYYGLETSSPISPELFIYMCPALLYQIERRLCIVHYDELEDFMKSKNASIENKDKTGASVPPKSTSGELTFLAFGEKVTSNLLNQENVQVPGKSKQKWCKKKQTEESPIGRKLSDQKLNNRPDADWLQLKPLAGADDSVLSEDRLNETELTDLDGQLESPPKNFLSVEEDNNMHHSHNDVSHAAREHDLHDSEYDSHGEDKMIARKHSHHWHHKHSHHSHGHCHSGKDLKDTGIANIAWMVIMGDGIHNFSDGLAIGDFAVLLKAGMTVKQAIVYNLLSAMMAYVGMLIGTAVGQYANNITLWIFAITAGMFLYVALVDMLPEMLHGDGDNEEHGYCPVGQFILQNLGLLLGFAIMLVIALYEDKIVLDIQF
ncbi:zinc transporter zip10 [Limosa lapponica baueri]|uniref:Zinc transporter zip10 n=1 Tax=Limosa lapponica baueri TaxID=1758121 RepID=A0A2I0UF45_LIMLA|nr:zinc transporter zip10 [Limosa lapponica baueri]